MVLRSQPRTADDFDRELNILRALLAQKSHDLDEATAQIQQEITKRQTLERELETQKAMFDAFFQAANIGMVMVDTELRHVHINPALAEVNGLSVEKHKGKTLSEIVPDVARTVEPVYREVLATGKALFNVEVHGATLKDPDTIQYWVNSYFPLRGVDGTLIGAGAVIVDVTNLKQVEAQLQQTLQELNYHTENSPLATVEWNQNLEVRRWSKRAEQLFGWAAQEVVGQQWQDLAVIVERDRAQMNSMINRLLDGTDAHNVSHSRSYTKDGHIIDCEWYNSVLLDEAGNLKSIVSLVLDVTEQKQAEAALRKSEATNRAMLSAVPDLMIRMHRDGTWLDYLPSKGFQNLLPPEQAIGRNIRDILPSAIAQERMKYVEQAFCTHEPQLHEFALEVDGKILYEEARIVVCGDNEVLTMVRDITERKRAEQALNESEVRNRALFNAIPDIIIQMTGAGQYLTFKPGKNASVMKPGLIRDHVTTIFDVLPHDLAAKRIEYVQKALATGEVQSYEYQIVLDGEVRDEEARIVCCGENEVICIVRDISDRKRSEAALKQQAQELEQTLQQLQRTQAKLVQNEKMSSLGQLVAGIAHEINNPINFIYGNLDYTASYTQDLLNLVLAYQAEHPTPSFKIQNQLAQIDLAFVQEDLPKLVASMRHGTERIRQIVKSLRTFSRLDEADMKTVDLHEGIDSALMILKSRFHPTGNRPAIDVVTDYGRLPPVDCYAGQLNQVFMNLLTNAIDALDETASNQSLSDWQPQITIRTQCLVPAELATPVVCICITDNGSGIDQQIQSQIFNPFFTTKPVGQGTGLGLSTSYQIVTEKHNGTLTFHSLPGTGTEFVICIPIAQDGVDARPPRRDRSTF